LVARSLLERGLTRLEWQGWQQLTGTSRLAGAEQVGIARAPDGVRLDVFVRLDLCGYPESAEWVRLARIELAASCSRTGVWASCGFLQAAGEWRAIAPGGGP